ncbi:MAG: hypothetical protein JWP43_181, partial [Ramlibacter sp.]|nr:hypothetical protein [Ramlibacter sp.]
FIRQFSEGPRVGNGTNSAKVSSAKKARREKSTA